MRVPQRVRAALDLLAEAFTGWQRDNAPRLGAALAYYTLFSMAPLLIVAVAIAALVFGQEAAHGQLYSQLKDLVGEAGAITVEQMIEQSRKPRSGALATVIAVVTLFLGATGVFNELKGALNIIWDVPENTESGWLSSLLRDRLAAFAMVLVVGFMLLVSLVISAVLSAADGFLAGHMEGWAVGLQVLNTALSLVTITVLFAMIFKVLPDTSIAWRDVWVGAILTSLLFTAGKYLIGLYLGRSGMTSVYGAAGSVVILIVWVYYAAQIFFFGAELTQAYARRYGSRSGAAAGRDQGARTPAEGFVGQ